MATATSELEALEAAARQADEEASKVRERIDGCRRRINVLKAERLRLAVEFPKDFDQEGRPKKGSDAAKVVAELEAAQQETSHDALLAAAEERAKRAHRAVADYRGANAVALAEALRPKAEGVVHDITAALDALHAATGRYFEVEREATAILTDVQGLDGQDLPRSDRIAQLRRFASKELGETFPLPLPRSLVNQPAYPALKVPGPEGGWVRPQNAREEVAA